MRNRRGRAARVLVIGMVIGTSCASDGAARPGSSSLPTVSSAVGSSTSELQLVDLGLPDTPAGRQLTWVLQRGGTATMDDVIAHFSPSFLAAVPADSIVPTLQSLGTVDLVDTASIDDTNLSATIRAIDGTLVLAMIRVDTATPNPIVSLTFSPAELPDPPTSWSDVDARLDQLAATTSMLAAEVADDATFVVALDRTPDQPGAIGSAFTLYVLGMLSDRIGGGDLSWDDELTITAENKSFPSGRLQDRPEGSTVTIREAAELMISISDNTATDLLIDAIGRDVVEQILAPMGMGEPSQALTLPLLTTREFFILKWATDPAARDAYVAAGVGERRRILTTLPDELPSTDLIDPSTPTAVDTVEWFASASELARAQLWVDSQRGLPGQDPLEQILGANPGVLLDPVVWTQYSFTGGSEPGVVSLSWLLTRADGRRFVVSIIANDTSASVDERDAVSIATGVIDLLATT